LCWLAGNSSNRESYGPHNGYGVGNAIVRIGFSVPVTPITNRVFSTVSEQAALCRIYRREFDCILALLAVPFLVALKLIEQCPVNTLSFRLANWALPDAAQRRVDLRLLRKMDKVFDILNVLPPAPTLASVTTAMAWAQLPIRTRRVGPAMVGGRSVATNLHDSPTPRPAHRHEIAPGLLPPQRGVHGSAGSDHRSWYRP
jgi:hypothetical protein